MYRYNPVPDATVVRANNKMSDNVIFEQKQINRCGWEKTQMSFCHSLFVCPP